MTSVNNSSEPVTLEHSRRRQLPPALAGVPWRIRDAVWLVGPWFAGQIALVAAAYLIRPVWAAPSQLLMLAAKGSNMIAAFGLNLIEAAFGAWLFWILLQRHHVGWQAAGFRRFPFLKALVLVVVVWLAFLVAAQVVLTLIAIIVPNFNPAQTQVTEFSGAGSQAEMQLAFIALVIMPPIMEETVFRGLVFPAIANRLGAVWGMILSSAVFAMAHFQPNIVVYTFVLGLILCWLYLKFKSTIPGMMLHMLNNGLAFWALMGHRGG